MWELIKQLVYGQKTNGSMVLVIVAVALKALGMEEFSGDVNQIINLVIESGLAGILAGLFHKLVKYFAGQPQAIPTK